MSQGDAEPYGGTNLAKARWFIVTLGNLMKKSTAAWLGVAAVVVLVTAIVLTRLISGGQETFMRVAEALKTHAYIISRVGTPVTHVIESDGPSEVSRAMDGRRDGYYSVAAEGPKGKTDLKAYWRERADRSIEIYAIFSTKPWAQDELVWGKALK